MHRLPRPPTQQGTATSLHLERGTDEERRADFVASLLGLRKVGWIFTQSVQERDFIMSTEEVCQMAAMQDELGEQAVTAVVSMVPSEDGAPLGVAWVTCAGCAEDAAGAAGGCCGYWVCWVVPFLSSITLDWVVLRQSIG